MNFVELLFEIPDDLRKLYRKLESTCKKLINVKWSIAFNNVCVKENILPNYTRIRHHDPAVANTPHTLEYRQYLIKRDIEVKERNLVEICQQRDELDMSIKDFQFDLKLKVATKDALNLILQNSEKVQKTKTLKKINELYKGQILLQNKVNCFVNLSKHNLSPTEIEFLNLGTNYHIQPKYDKLHKAT